MADKQRINGNVYSWSSIVLKLDQERFTGFTSIKYGDSRERGKAYGTGRHHAPIGRTGGKYQTDPVALKGRKDSVRALIAGLRQRSLDGNSYGDVEFEIVVQFVEGDLVPITDELVRCVITKVSADHEENADPSEEEVEIDCMQVRRDGATLFDGSGGRP